MIKKTIVEESFNEKGVLTSRKTTVIEGEETMVQPVGPVVDDSESKFDEELKEKGELYDHRMITLNEKESFDIHRGDDRSGFRRRERDADLLFIQTLADREQARRHSQEDHDMRMRQAEILFSERAAQVEDNRTARKLAEIQAVRHGDLAGIQGMRDQARDSGESAFPKPSSLAK